MTLLAIDRSALEGIAQWLEARSDPLAAAVELRTLVASAPSAVSPALLESVARVLGTHASHTCAVHVERPCSLCRVEGELEKWRLQR